MSTLLTLLNAYPRACLKVYENEKEHKVRYNFENYGNNTFIVLVNHVAEEPDSKHCDFNISHEIPCACTSTYMQSRCMEKCVQWSPSGVQEVYCVIAQLANFTDPIESFSIESLCQGFENFKKIFKYNGDITKVPSFGLVEDKESASMREVTFTSGTKKLKMIFES